MMRSKSRLADPALWILVAINVYLVYYYYQHKEVFTTLIWLYWAQSVLLGLFNFLDMITTPANAIPMGNTNEGKTVASASNNATKAVNALYDKNTGAKYTSRTATSFFFLIHYGFFHFAYLFFIATMPRSGPFQWDLFKYFLIAFVVGQVVTFVQHKRQQRTVRPNLGTMFFIPYLRIIPMHLTILLPAFMHITNYGVFLILKAFADVAMYLLTRPSNKNKSVDQTLLASQQSMNL
jgi:hypothetical protein